MNRAPSRLVLASCLLLLAAPALAAGDPKLTAECAGKTVSGNTSVQTVSIQSKDESGDVKLMKGTIWWKRDAAGMSSVRVLVAEPLDMRGSGALLIQQPERTDLFVYLPELKKVRRVTGKMLSGSLFGTDITYEQLERVQGIAREAKLERRDDDAIDGRAVFVVQSSPLVAEETEYSRVVSFVDKQTCVPLRIEFLGADGQARRVLDVDPTKIVPQGSGFVPMRVTMKDVPSATETVLSVDKIEIGTPIPEVQFTQGILESEGR